MAENNTDDILIDPISIDIDELTDVELDEELNKSEGVEPVEEITLVTEGEVDSGGTTSFSKEQEDQKRLEEDI